MNNLNQKGFNELDQLVEVIGVPSLIDNAIKSFESSVDPVVFTLQDEDNIENSTSELASINNEVGAPYSEPTWATIPYNMIDSKSFRTLDLVESKDQQFSSFRSGFDPSNSSTFTPQWESWEGIRVFWKVFGFIPRTGKDDGVYYIYDGKKVEKLEDSFIPVPLRWTIETKERIIGRVLSNISYSTKWNEILPLLSVSAPVPTILHVRWNKKDGTPPINETINLNSAQENFPVLLSNIFLPHPLSRVIGEVTFYIENDPINVKTIEILGLVSIVTGKITKVTEKWIRPSNQTGIIMVGVDDDTFDSIKSNNIGWSDIRRNVLQSTSLSQAGGYLFFGIWSIVPEGWDDKSWFADAMEDDRVRHISFTPGLWEFQPTTAWENTRRKWEEIVLRGGSISELKDWLNTGGDSDSVATQDDINSVDDPDSLDLAVSEIKDIGDFDDVVEVKAIASAFETLGAQSHSQTQSVRRILNKVSREMNRTNGFPIPSDKLSDPIFQSKSVNALTMVGSAVVIGVAAYSLLQSGSLCRIKESCTLLANRASIFWNKMEKIFNIKGIRRPTGAKQLFSAWKATLIKKFSALKIPAIKLQLNISKKMRALRNKLSSLKLSLSKPDFPEIPKCQASCRTLERQVSK